MNKKLYLTILLFVSFVVFTAIVHTYIPKAKSEARQYVTIPTYGLV